MSLLRINSVPTASIEKVAVPRTNPLRLLELTFFSPVISGTHDLIRFAMRHLNGTLTSESSRDSLFDFAGMQRRVGSYDFAWNTSFA